MRARNSGRSLREDATCGSGCFRRHPAAVLPDARHARQPAVTMNEDHAHILVGTRLEGQFARQIQRGDERLDSNDIFDCEWVRPLCAPLTSLSLLFRDGTNFNLSVRPCAVVAQAFVQSAQ